MSLFGEIKETQEIKPTPHIHQKEGAAMVPITIKLLHHRKEYKVEELVMVLERARLVRINLGSKLTGCTWSLKASFLAL